ncbi:uncharacterized protein KY384_001589 [Bacidia gigantensis]|uniref:uncharacterized protein n=1 Tax=Bacidia gigantensis TaxID=2732470 RepID=UPI001D052AC4|nr:uncharacterized protein KY384_001589 [Bacidia gigantensis]KAG8533848.1 hypothetical protein KY384_001589 [Bacidia gigantensis]
MASSHLEALINIQTKNEHREYLSDIIIYDIKTSHWTQPGIRGPLPKGRARHAAAVHDDKLYIVGGLSGTETVALDEICFLDLRTWTWSRCWSFVPRFDHSAFIWDGRIWVYGGLGPDYERSGDIWWLDLKGSPAFKSVPALGRPESPQAERAAPARSNQAHQQNANTGSTGYTANSSSVQRGSSKSLAPGAITSVRFASGPDTVAPAAGTHFHAYSSGALLDFTTPAGMVRHSECNLSSLDLSTLQWQKLISGPDIFDPSYRWHYCLVNEDGTKAWLLGCEIDQTENGLGNLEEYLSDVLPLDLRRYGLLGDDPAALSSESFGRRTASTTEGTASLSTLSSDFAGMFDHRATSDFIVTASNDDVDDDMSTTSAATENATISNAHDEVNQTSSSIHVHSLILQARWPHFQRLYNSEMAEFHTKKLHIPEPYSVVRAFLYYLYTDSISKQPDQCTDLDDVAGMLVLAQMYDIPRLRLLCLNRLSRELDVEHAAVIWERAGIAQDAWLQQRAATYCMTHWGRVVRTNGFRQLSRRSMMELCVVVDEEGRVIGGEELEVIGGLGGGKVGAAGSSSNEGSRRRAVSQAGTTVDEENDVQDDEGMEMS